MLTSAFCDDVRQLNVLPDPDDGIHKIKRTFYRLYCFELSLLFVYIVRFYFMQVSKNVDISDRS
jgi:hypothetical protein